MDCNIIIYEEFMENTIMLHNFFTEGKLKPNKYENVPNGNGLSITQPESWSYVNLTINRVESNF